MGLRHLTSTEIHLSDPYTVGATSTQHNRWLNVGFSPTVPSHPRVLPLVEIHFKVCFVLYQKGSICIINVRTLKVTYNCDMFYRTQIYICLDPRSGPLGLGPKGRHLRKPYTVQYLNPIKRSRCILTEWIIPSTKGTGDGLSTVTHEVVVSLVFCRGS